MSSNIEPLLDLAHRTLDGTTDASTTEVLSALALQSIAASLLALAEMKYWEGR